jgi:hypothetical protein
MLSIDKCKEILNVGDKRYTESQIKQLRELLSTLAEIELNQIIEEIGNNKAKVIVLKNYFLPMLKAA